ncbi:antirestriction protein [Yersinia mollaretii]|uniref:antirestriction protein n=1 Tax=Yersinia mollaretii TaxID=33060 RepID=UPI00005F86DA|nr:antirestriction protein [Yersinia mollaretii]QKJ01760.1 antirestriction protein [Yersinia mollaretii ATCC 43969]
MNTQINTGTNTLTATRVSDAQRIYFWPKCFGQVPKWALIEPQVFRWLDRLCDDYRRDFWDFYTLPNGGAFMVPGTKQDYVLFNALNGNGATVSREAAGIIACLMTYSHHACHTESEAITDHFYRLREYALQHPESQAIFDLID